MANRSKKNPRTSFVIARATKDEKLNLEKQAKTNGYPFSKYVRKLLGFIEDNE
jgi:hypothetical protein